MLRLDVKGDGNENGKVTVDYGMRERRVFDVVSELTVKDSEQVSS